MNCTACISLLVRLVHHRRQRDGLPEGIQPMTLDGSVQAAVAAILLCQFYFCTLDNRQVVVEFAVVWY